MRGPARPRPWAPPGPPACRRGGLLPSPASSCQLTRVHACPCTEDDNSNNESTFHLLSKALCARHSNGFMCTVSFNRHQFSEVSIIQSYLQVEDTETQDGQLICSWLIPAAVAAQSLSRVRLFSTSWTVARQALLPMGCSRQEHWRGPPFPLPGPGITYTAPRLLHWQADAFH